MSLSSTTTCQECSRSFKDFQGLSCGEKNHDPDHLPGVFKVLQLSTKRVPLLFKSLFFETSIMNHFQITKPNKSIINPRTKLKPNQTKNGLHLNPTSRLLSMSFDRGSQLVVRLQKFPTKLAGKGKVPSKQ